ncbi:MAG: hypothetical protein WAM69_07445 [Candidatus Sulfotelmatobacter sp.]
MSATVQVGTILMKKCPEMAQLLQLESEPCWGNWTLVSTLDGVSVDRKIRAAGWNFFFMAAEVKAMFFGVPGATKIQDALQRILAKVKQEHFNGLEVTGIVASHFLGVPYVTVSAHSRHMQRGCYLDNSEARQASHDSTELARG